MSKHSPDWNPDDLTEAEIRALLSAKLRSSSGQRLEHYRRTGWRVEMVPDIYAPTLENIVAKSTDGDAEIERQHSTKAKRPPADKILVFVEVIAIAGFIYFFANGFGLHHLLNREVSAAIDLPASPPHR